jgi:hypothetical protein
MGKWVECIAKVGTVPYGAVLIGPAPTHPGQRCKLRESRVVGRSRVYASVRDARSVIIDRINPDGYVFCSLH